MQRTYWPNFGRRTRASDLQRCQTWLIVTNAFKEQPMNRMLIVTLALAIAGSLTVDSAYARPAKLARFRLVSTPVQSKSVCYMQEVRREWLKRHPAINNLNDMLKQLEQYPAADFGLDSKSQEAGK